MKIRDFVVVLLVCAAVFSCKTPANITYFQDASDGAEYMAVPSKGIVIKPFDKLAIVVYSRDYQLSNLFNLPYHANRIGATSETQNTNTNSGIGQYTVDVAGDIDFPVLGKLHLAGKTATEAEAFVTSKLLESGLIQDPVVTLTHTNYFVSVMGEVARPSRIALDRDDFTIFDALGAAGDLTITGERENVLVSREENGVKKTYVINLCSMGDVMSSPAYYMRPGDVVYVSPNRMRKRQSTVNGNNIESASFWVSVASLLATITNVLLINLVTRR